MNAKEYVESIITKLNGIYRGDLESAYDAGANEARKSMRCETCAYYLEECCMLYAFDLADLTNFIGCADHAERKENG